MQALINRITRRGQVHQAEEQTSFWAKDSEFKACYGCDAEFTFFLRKHHCRMCGGYVHSAGVPCAKVHLVAVVLYALLCLPELQLK